MTDLTYYRRNYIAEVKGETSDVTSLAILRSSTVVSSFGMRIVRPTTSLTSRLRISSPTSSMPTQRVSWIRLVIVTNIMGGVTYSVVDGSSSTGLTIKGIRLRVY